MVVVTAHVPIPCIAWPRLVLQSGRLLVLAVILTGSTFTILDTERGN